MKKFGSIMVASIAAASTMAFAGIDPPTTLALWTFETSIPTNAGPHAAEGGVNGGPASGFHTSGATVYSNPVGNGSVESFSSNNWGAGDWYRFGTSTTGYENIRFGWSQTRSSTGPSAFLVQWTSDLDGGVWNDLLSVEVGAVTWTSLSFTPDSVFGPIDLPAAAADQGAVYVRVLATAGGTAAGGTNRIDDVGITGTEITVKPPACIGNINGDGIVDGADLATVLGQWGTAGPAGDLNGDNIVDGADLALVLGNWGPCPL